MVFDNNFTTTFFKKNKKKNSGKFKKKKKIVRVGSCGLILHQFFVRLNQQNKSFFMTLFTDKCFEMLMV